MRIFLASLTGSTKDWSNALPSGSLTTPEDLEQVFLKIWGVVENMASLYSQHLKICKQNDENIREFNDRFNTLIGQLETKFHQESTVLEHYLNSFEGELQFILKNRFLMSVGEEQDVACRIE